MFSKFSFIILPILIKFSVCELNSFSATTPPSHELDSKEGSDERQARGMMMIDYDHEDHQNSDDHDDIMIMKDSHAMEQQKAVSDPWAGYYDFLINEGSFKFWAVFQLITALLLIYSAFAAIYYAKFNVITTDYDYYDGFWGRSNSETSSINNDFWSGLSSQTFQRIFDALSSKKYS